MNNDAKTIEELRSALRDISAILGIGLSLDCPHEFYGYSVDGFRLAVDSLRNKLADANDRIARLEGDSLDQECHNQIWRGK